MSELEFEDNLEKSLSGLTRSVLDTACSELEMEALALHTNEPQNQEEEETASEEERTEYFRTIRQEEYIQLIENAEREREMSEQALHTKDGKAGNTNEVDFAVEREQAEGQEEHARHQLGEESTGERFTQTTTDEETAGEEERMAFFQAVRDAEYKKLLVAVERDPKREVQKDQETKIALTDKQCDDFFNVAVDDLAAVYTKKQPPQQNDYNQQPGISADETYSYFNHTSPKSTPSVSDTSADAPVIIQYNDETGSTKNVFTTTENKKAFERSVSDVGVERQKYKNRLILNLFKRSKSLSTFEKDLPTQTCEKKAKEEKPFERSVSDVGVKKQKSKNRQILNLFKRSKSLSNFEKNLPTQTCEKKAKEETVIQKLELPAWDADDFMEPPKPILKPFFSTTEAAELIKPVVVDTEEDTSRGNIFSRASRRFRGWLRNLSCCCCCKSDIVDNTR